MPVSPASSSPGADVDRSGRRARDLDQVVVLHAGAAVGRAHHVVVDGAVRQVGRVGEGGAGDVARDPVRRARGEARGRRAGRRCRWPARRSRRSPGSTPGRGCRSERAGIGHRLQAGEGGRLDAGARRLGLSAVAGRGLAAAGDVLGRHHVRVGEAAGHRGVEVAGGGDAARDELVGGLRAGADRPVDAEAVGARVGAGPGQVDLVGAGRGRTQAGRRIGREARHRRHDLRSWRPARSRRRWFRAPAPCSSSRCR